ncbi:Phage protein Gp37/Gp68 [Rosistilla oblonga]|uniref:DUF5131 family protein n=1 Tax=Rosistilla oblonga TaxID=2527990 RepID=UPI001188DC1C|nr:DUF5131 family protein [Rosistilla oblonga]QDV11499.1 Phage protein Gp37/Gp68 [Rosistilla oblonga]
MSDTRISWVDYTWNPWIGCSKVSQGCSRCYIETPLRNQGREPFQGPIRCTDTWRNPERWNQNALQLQSCKRVLVGTMSDFFHEGADEWRAEAWETIHRCQALDWFILTKRPECVRERLPANWGEGYPNVWLGVTVERQSCVGRIDTIWDNLAANYFVVAEPLLGTVTFGDRIDKVDWVIAGCESWKGDFRTHMSNSWVRSIRDECDWAGVPFFLKQRYVDGVRKFDGEFDGVIRQDFPRSRRLPTSF